MKRAPLLGLLSFQRRYREHERPLFGGLVARLLARFLSVKTPHRFTG